MFLMQINVSDYNALEGRGSETDDAELSDCTLLAITLATVVRIAHKTPIRKALFDAHALHIEIRSIAGNPYGDSHGSCGDNQFRFTLLCHAACEAPLVLLLGGYTYGEKCLFRVNDWHAGLVPGVEPAASFKNLGLPSNWYGALEWVFPTWARTHALDTGEAVNILKGAIVTADRILTVSKVVYFT
ncbi:putative SNARE-like superfamily protein [Hibiscus syriacus]|uniref:SNARE-like superfamily protein n=1 Tax=Hibiscus syriacus TaxID=106335 RepID=A0A6A2YPZ1_HIBSY|nr:putative SNARE-like superfamily protein [Hibiscus syriacus]